MPAAFSMGVWLEGAVAFGALYRWEADEGRNGRGHVLLDVEAGTVRPATETGEPIGDLVVRIREGATSGEAEGVDRRAVLQVAGALQRAQDKSDGLPGTAHAHYG